MIRRSIGLCLLFASTAGAHAADMTKTLQVAFPVAENGFDPQVIYDTYSDSVCAAIFDPLYKLDYFARPVRMLPNTADGLPQIADGGRTYTIKVQPGIYFAADPAFKGKKRELTAQDYVYSIKRMFDPKVRSYDLYLLENNLVGLDEPLARARKSGTFDYDEKIEGLQALDRYTLQIKFRRPEYGFRWWLAARDFAAVAREVVEAYGDASHRVMENPVGTGPYRLKSWTRGQEIVLEANPAIATYVIPRLRPVILPMRRSPRHGRPRFADRRQRRNQHHRGGTAASLDVRARQARLPVPRQSAVACGDHAGRRPVEARAGETWHRALARRRSESRFLFFQYGRRGGRRIHAGEDRVAPRDQPRLRSRGQHQALAVRAGDPGVAAGSAGLVRPRSRIHTGADVRSRSGTRASRQVRLQGSRRRRLSR
jgi:hypothetical protein